MNDKFFTWWAVFCAVLGLAFTGLIAWAVIELVMWVTAQ